MDATSTTPQRSPALVAIAAWLLPGLGYWMIGQRTRSLTIGVSILLLFLAGLLIGGVRVLDVPGYNAYGQPIQVTDNQGTHHSIMAVNPWGEIKNKPWSMAQILAGPVSIFGGAGSVLASQPSPSSNYAAPAEVSHTPVNEAGTLYTSVAGMLNLLAIIDAAYRAGRQQPEDDGSGRDGSRPAQSAAKSEADRRREVA